MLTSTPAFGLNASNAWYQSDSRVITTVTPDATLGCGREPYDDLRGLHLLVFDQKAVISRADAGATASEPGLQIKVLAFGGALRTFLPVEAGVAGSLDIFGLGMDEGEVSGGRVVLVRRLRVIRPRAGLSMTKLFWWVISYLVEPGGR